MATPTLDEAAIFNIARRMTGLEERHAYLLHSCGADPSLFARLEAMLRLFDQEPHYLETASDQPQLMLFDPFFVEPGMELGPYKLIKPIGEGGMGSVFLAEQTQPVKRQVAIKIIKPGLDWRRVQARFEAERQALALMDHPNIAKVLDVGATQPAAALAATTDMEGESARAAFSARNRPYFVMELVEGVPITHYCDEHCLTPHERLQLFIPICYAVQHAHQKGIIHRDLKPSNVLIAEFDGKPVPKIIDFGVAKAVEATLGDRTQLTELGSVVGTLEYMSPEQAEPGQHDVDTRSDIYSLGALLYELLAGSTPFQATQLHGAAVLELLRIVREVDPPTPSSRLSTTEELPAIAAKRRLEARKLSGMMRGDLDWIVMKCLEKNRSRRYGTATELARDLERYLHDEPVEARPPSKGYLLRRFAWRNRKLLITSTAFATLLLVGTALSAWQAVRALLAERLARDNERDALVVKSFLQDDLLGQADIANQEMGTDRNRNITVRELLDRAAQRIGSRFQDQELTEASIRLTLGKAYLALGEHDKAQAQLEHCLELRRAKLGPDNLATLEALHVLGVTFLEAKKLDEAAPRLQQALSGFQAQLGPTHVDTLMATQNLALALGARGRYDESEQLLKQVLPELQRQLGPDHRETLATLGNLAHLYHVRGRDREAEPLLQEVLERRRASLGSDHPHTLASMEDLANVKRVCGQFDEAERLYKQALLLRRAKLGENHASTLESMNGLALLYRDRGQYTLAEPLLQKALQIQQATHGANDVEALASMNSLAALYRDQGNFAAAEPLFKQVLAGWTAALGPNHPRTLISENNLATLYLSQEKYGVAEPLLKHAGQGARTHLGRDHPLTLQTLFNLGGLYLEQARYQEAAPVFREVFEARRVKLGPDHLDTIASLNSIALVQRATGDFKAAEPSFQKVLETRQARLGPDHPETIRSMNNLALLYRDTQRIAEAERLLEQAAARSKPKLGMGHPQTRNTLVNLADVYAREGKFERAEPLLREVIAYQHQKSGPNSAAYAHQLSRLAQNLLDQKKYAEAEATARECLTILGEQEPKAWSTFRAQSLLGATLLGQKKFAQAEPVLLAGYQGMKDQEGKIPKESRTQVKQALEQLCDLYTAWNKPEQARQWREKLAAASDISK
jgi:eukaryotic-like serine/threonine-protein kinase